MLQELFERQADARPGHIALACGTARMAYGELEQKATQLARHLRARGVRRGGFVALLLPRSMDVYVALLAALKAGAAYVPLDPDYPADRVEYILGDCGALALITTSALAEKCGAFKGIVIELDKQSREIAAESDARLTRAEIETTAEDLAYVIYTSGSTGRPKGVMIEHRAVCNLVRAEGQIFHVTPNDRVFQGFSIAFDASVEEVWLAFFAGATLVAGTREMVQAGSALPRMLTEAGVTVLSSVPTLFAMMEEDIPTARLLITGGEACPQHLLARWCKPGRRVVNTYGPTEATVIATFGDCDPQRPVTIGRPVPNYVTYILDEQLRPVPLGEIGELHLGCVGLARGYVGRPDLTAEKFVANPFAAEDGSAKLYKTGDLARFTADGEIEFMGRADSQVKLRGFRIELAEIESVLLQCPGVRAAAVTLREDVPGLQQLVGYIVPTDGAPDENATKSQLRSRLPAYMVPALLESIAALPALPSGKVDRKQLPPPRPRSAEAKSAGPEPRTDLERKIHAVWSRLFAPANVALDDDFFLSLGGHSLLAARMISELRKDAALQNVSILDIYNHPTLESLAAKIARDRPSSSQTGGSEKVHRASSLSHFLCGCAQFVGLYFVLGFFALQWLAPYLTYTWMVEDDYEHWEAIAGAFTVLVALYPCMLAASVVIKWTVIGRYREGEYPLWGVYYFRWWFVNTIQGAIPIGYLSGTPLLNIYYRLMGARIGANVHLGADNFAIFDLLEIGRDTSIGTDASVLGYTVENGFLKIAPVKIGERCFVGTRSVVREGARMEDGAMLEDLSLLSAGEIIPAGERWLGSPARFTTKAAESFAADVGSGESAPHPISLPVVRGEGA
ncbi:MAG: amino acid adenylation domain-containing protein [Verrucomicrobia bacterium]|nr:amino acid adenylation domain-containing protein [Verrucomicrobiota bacterium]